MRNNITYGFAALVLAIPLVALGADWPQWRGPDRNGVSKEKGLLQQWPEGGPQLVWTYKDAGTGFTSPAIVGGKVYTMGARKDEECVIALDDKGKEMWATKIAPPFDFNGNSWNLGPNATPAVDGNLVFALGSQGELLCVNKDDGKKIWSKNLPTDLSAEVNPVGGGPGGWGFTWSPQVDGDKLVITPGGRKGLLAALDKKTGNVLWQSKAVTDQTTYASPVVVNIHGVRQYVVMTQNGVVGITAENGDLLWRYNRETEFPDVVCSTPIVVDDQVYITAWGGGSTLLKIAKEGKQFKATEVYYRKELSNRQGGVVLVDKNFYGFHETNRWMSIDFATGNKTKWESKPRQLGAGSVVYADGRLYVMAEEMDVVALLDPSATEFKEVSRFKLPQSSKLRRPRGKTWTYPAISDGHLYLRDQELIFCYKIK